MFIHWPFLRAAVGAVTEDVNELEEKEEQLPSWNRRGGPKGRGGSKVEIVLLDSNERMGRRVIRSSYHPGAARHLSCNSFTSSVTELQQPEAHGAIPHGASFPAGSLGIFGMRSRRRDPSA